MKLDIYTDASFSKTHGLAVIGYMISDKLTILEIKESNNIRAEIRGVITALSAAPKSASVTLYTDCQTVAGLIGRRDKLEKTNFISQAKQTPLANADLYKEFYKIYDQLHPEIIWVKGHTSSKDTKIKKNFSTVDKEVRKALRLALK
ncbi:MAG: RNase H family protein [Bdellovibrionota bacterium]